MRRSPCSRSTAGSPDRTGSTKAMDVFHLLGLCYSMLNCLSYITSKFYQGRLTKFAGCVSYQRRIQSFHSSFLVKMSVEALLGWERIEGKQTLEPKELMKEKK